MELGEQSNQWARICTIEGNFSQDGRWANPDPSFEGEFLVDEEGRLYGYMKELRRTPYDPLRFIAGYCLRDGKDSLICCFFKFSNDLGLKPLMYDNFHTWKQSGAWAAVGMDDIGIIMIRQGEARIEIREASEYDYSPQRVSDILTKFAKLDEIVNLNGLVFDELDLCKRGIEKYIADAS